VFSIIGDHDLVKILFTEIAPRYKTRNGGYTRIFPLLGRRGDNASQVIFELTEKVVKVKIKREKPKKEEAKAAAQEIPAGMPATGEVPVQPAVKPKPELKEKPAKKQKAVERLGPEEKPKWVEKPKPREVEKPKVKIAKPKGLFGGLGKLFKRQKDI
jgi:hypothetical protein